MHRLPTSTSLNSLAFIAISALFFFLSCTPKAKSPGQELVVALENQHETLDWSYSETVDGIVDLTTEPLLTYKVLENASTELVGALADSWEPSQKGKVWTLKLKKNIVWSDGKELTADHARDGLLRLINPKNPNYLISLFHIIRGVKEFINGTTTNSEFIGIIATDKHTLKFFLTHPVFHFPHLLTFYQASPVRLDLIKKFGEKNWLKPGNFVGIGPYLIKEHKPESHLKLKANPKYYNGEREVKNIVARYIADEGTVLRLFKSNQVHFSFNVPVRNIEELKSKKEFHLVRGTSPASLKFDPKHLDKFPEAFRKAVYWAIDRNQISKVYPFSNPEWNLVPSKFFALEKPTRPERSNTDFSELYKNQKIDFYYFSSENYKILSEYIQEQLQTKLNVAIRLRPLEWQQFNERTKKNELPFYLSIIGPDYNDPHSLMEFNHSQSTQNTAKWINKKYDQLIESAEKEFDPEKRIELYKQASKIFLQDRHTIPLFSFTYPYLINSNYIGFRMPEIYRIDLRSLKVVPRTTAQ